MSIPVIYPMGAVTEKKEEKMEKLWLDPQWISERKYDGSRYLIRIEDEITVVSRQPSKKTGLPVDKTGNVPHLAQLFSRLPKGTILDGEVITHENCKSNEVTSIMGCDPEQGKAIEKQKEQGWVKYVIFDILYWNGHDVTHHPYSTRRKVIETLYEGFYNDPHNPNYNPTDKDYIWLAPIYTDNKEAIYNQIVEGGGEGVILKNLHAPYVATQDKKGKKPKDTWVKVKKYDTYDVVIMGFTDSTKYYSGKDINTWHFWVDKDGEPFYRQNEDINTLALKGYKAVTKPFYYGWIGAVEFGQYNEAGELVRIGQTSGIPDDTKQYMTDNQEDLIGKVIEVGAMEQDKTTFSLRHPRFLMFRSDKAPEQCILGQV